MSQNKLKDESYKNDFQTPVPVSKYMVSLLPDNAKDILEPTTGMGNIENAVIETGRAVTAPADYFKMDHSLRFDAVVMNPPFSSKTAFGVPEGFEKHGMRLGYHILMECMEKAPIIIALMPWFTISDSDVRLRFLKNFGLISLTALPRKTFQYARIQTVVIHLQKGYTSTTEFKVFDLL